MAKTRSDFRLFESRHSQDLRDSVNSKQYFIFKTEAYLGSLSKREEEASGVFSSFSKALSIFGKSKKFNAKNLPKAEILAFTQASSRKALEGQLVEKNFDVLNLAASSSNTLFIEDPDPYQKSDLGKKFDNTYDSSEIHSFAASKTPSISVKDKLSDFLKEFCNDHDIDAESALQRHEAYKEVYTSVLSQVSPKIIFIHSWFAHQALIEVAKELKIPIIEIQHGLIGDRHPMYHSEVRLPSVLAPDEFWCWGEVDKKSLVESVFLLPDKIQITGNFLLEEMKKRCMDKKATKLDGTILVTLQDQIEDETIDFLEELARINPSLKFDLLPQSGTREQHDHERIGFVDGSFYDLISRYPLHATVYSTTALESIAFEVPTILIDVKGLATSFMGSYAHQIRHLLISDSPKKFVGQFASLTQMADDDRKADMETFVASDSIERVKTQLKRLGIE